MSSSPDADARLAELTRLLHRYRPVAPDVDAHAAESVPADVAALALRSVTIERIHAAAADLRDGLYRDRLTESEATAARLLLDDYTAAIRYLRAAAHDLHRRIARSASIVREVDKIVERDRMRLADARVATETIAEEIRTLDLS